MRESGHILIKRYLRRRKDQVLRNIIVKSHNILSVIPMDLLIQMYFTHTECLHLANRVYANITYSA